MLENTERVIYVLLEGVSYPADERCCVAGCNKNATGKHWALLYEGEYTTDEEKGAGQPVCYEHS